MKTLCTVLVSLMLTESASVAVTCYEGISYYEDLSKGNRDPCKNKVNRPPKTTACAAKSGFFGFQGVCGWYVAKDRNSDGCYAVVGYCSQKSTTSACESNVYVRAANHGNEYRHYNTFGKTQTFEVERNGCCDSTNNCNFEALEKPKEAKQYVAKSGDGGTVIGIVVFIVVVIIIIAVCIALKNLQRMSKHKKKMAKKMFKHQQQQMAMQHQQQQMAMHQQQQMQAMNQFNQPVSMQPVMVKPVMAAGTVQPVGVVGVVGQPMGVPQTQAMGAPVVVSAQPQYAAQTAPVVVSAQPQYAAQTAPMVVSAQPQYGAQPVAVAAVPSTQKSAAYAPVTVVATAL